MKHYDRDTFTYETVGENAVGTSGITFTIGPDGKATRVLVENLNVRGEGVFTRFVGSTHSPQRVGPSTGKMPVCRDKLEAYLPALAKHRMPNRDQARW